MHTFLATLASKLLCPLVLSECYTSDVQEDQQFTLIKLVEGSSMQSPPCAMCLSLHISQACGNVDRASDQVCSVPGPFQTIQPRQWVGGCECG